MHFIYFYLYVYIAFLFSALENFGNSAIKILPNLL